MRFVFAIAALLGSAGCSKPGLHNQYDPGVEMKTAWQSGSVIDGKPLKSWWSTFDDSGLSRVVEQTLQQNHDVRAAAARVEAALAEALITGTELKPVMGGSLGSNRRKQNFIGFPIPGSEDKILKRTFSTFGVSLDVSWEADLWGRLRSEEVASYRSYEAQEAEFAALQLSLTGQASKAWFACMEAASQLSLARRTLDSFEASSLSIKVRFEAGMRPASELRLVLTDVATAESLVKQRSEQLARTVRQLEILTGRYPSGTLQPGHALPEFPGPVPAGLPVQIVARRPDLIAARKRLLAADAHIAASQAALYPSLTLTGSLGTSSDALKSLLDGDFSIWSLAGNALQPIFQSGRLRRGVELARARADEALQSYAAAVLRALAEVESALAAEAFLNEQVLALEEAIEQAGAGVALARLRYAGGIGDVLSMLEAQRRVLRTRSEMLTLQRMRLENRVDLHLALGGGFEIPTRTLAASISDKMGTSLTRREE